VESDSGVSLSGDDPVRRDQVAITTGRV